MADGRGQPRHSQRRNGWHRPFCRTATAGSACARSRKSCRIMEAGMNYPDAAKAAGYDHALLPTGEVSPTGYLPYYGEWLPDDVLGSGDPQRPKEQALGAISEPDRAYRARPTAPRRQRADPRIRRARRNRGRDDPRFQTVAAASWRRSRRSRPRTSAATRRARDELRKLGQADNARNLLKMRLWEELNPRDPLDRRCPYTGEKISASQRLLSEEVDIDHLIPFSRELGRQRGEQDRLHALRQPAKRKQTPFEAFGGNPTSTGTATNGTQISARAAACRRTSAGVSTRRARALRRRWAASRRGS